MKIKILLSALLLISIFSNAQITDRLNMIKSVCNQSELIIEGKALSVGKAFRATNQIIYTPYTVAITNTIFGKQNSSTIQILIEGGQIEENGIGLGTSVSHGLNLLLGANSIIFCSKAETNDISNSYLLAEQVCFSAKNEVVITNGLSEQYKNINDLLSDISSVLKIAVPQKKNTALNENKINNAIQYAINLENYNTLIAKKQAQYLLNQNAISLNKTLAQDVTLQVSTGTITGTSPQFLEFDVNIKSSNSASYLDNIPVWITYNTAVFSTSVVANGKVTITNGASFNNTQYLPANNYKSDQSINTFAFSVGTDYNLSNPTRVNITPTYKLLAHVKIEITYCGNATANLSNATTALNASFYTTTSTASSSSFLNYTSLLYNGSIANNLPCSINVFDFNSPINGGKDEILSIQGVSFGATRGNGHVKFRDANAAYHPFIQQLDNIDYVSWTDTLIKIKLPSVIQVSGLSQTPGSGPFIVKNNLGDSAVGNYNSSFQDLVVHYSEFQEYSTTLMNKYKLNLINANGLGGYTIRLDTSISNYPARKGCVIRAIKDWRCITAANIVLGNDTNLYTSANDKITTIYFTPSLAPGTVALTNNQTQWCTASGITTYSTRDFDIKVSRQFNYFYDTTGATLPTGMFDFYEIMVHEIGHGLGLKHVIDTTQIMYRATKQSNTSNISGANRRKLQPYSGDADGVLYSVTSSPTVIYGQCVNFNSHQISNTSCSLVGIYENLKNKYNFSVYPNPITTEKINLKFNASINSKAKVMLYDSFGRLLYSSQIENKTSEQNEFSFDMNNFASGLYLIDLNIDGYNFTQKIIKY
jgi:hypothetical protein